MTSVVIVDDDEWIRRGRADGLKAFADITVTALLDPGGALAFDYTDVDVVVVDAHDERQEWDRYPGVGVVERIRRARSPDQTLILVVSGHTLDPLLRLRMAEAGADFFYAHLDLPTPAALAGAIRHPDRSRRTDVLDRSALASLGLYPWSRPNAALRWTEDVGATRLFTEEGSQKSANGGRRAMARARDEIARRARLEPSLGDRARRPGDVTWRDVSRFVNRALGRHSR